MLCKSAIRTDSSCGEIDNQIGVLGCNRACRNFRRVIGIFGLPGVRDPIILAANGPNQTSDRALSRRGAWTVASINNRFAVSFATTPFRRDSFIVRIIEEDNFTRDSIARHRFQFVEVFNGNNFSANSFVRSSNASAERAEHDFLCRVFRHSRKLHQRCGFFAADPMRNHHFLQLHFAADRFQFARDIFNRFRRLHRSGQARADVVREMRDLPIRVIAAQRRLLQTF